LFTAERVPSRFILPSFLMLIVYGIINSDDDIKKYLCSFKGIALCGCGVVLVERSIQNNLSIWSFGKINPFIAKHNAYINDALLVAEPSSLYISSLYFGAFISLCSVLLWAICYYRVITK